MTDIDTSVADPFEVAMRAAIAAAQATGQPVEVTRQLTLILGGGIPNLGGDGSIPPLPPEPVNVVTLEPVKPGVSDPAQDGE